MAVISRIGASFGQINRKPKLFPLSISYTDYVVFGHLQSSYQYITDSLSPTLSSTVAAPSGANGSFRGIKRNTSSSQWVLSYDTTGSRASAGYTTDLASQGTGVLSSYSGFAAGISLILSDGKVVIGSNDAATRTTTNNGTSFSTASWWSGGDGDYVQSASSIGSRYVIVGQGGGGPAKYSDDSGSSVSVASPSITPGGTRVVSRNGVDSIVAATGTSRTIWYTTTGSSWYNTNLVGPSFGGSDVGYDLSNDLYYAVIGNVLYRARGEDPTYWELINTNLPTSIQYNQEFAVTRNGVLYLARYGSTSVYYSINNGLSWSSLSVASGKTFSWTTNTF